MDIEKIADMLTSRGDRYSGSDPEGIAADWADHFDDLAEIERWLAARCWDPATAYILSAAGLTPEQAREAADRMIAESDDPARDYTDGDPIYAAANGDLDPQRIVAGWVRR